MGRAEAIAGLPGLGTAQETHEPEFDRCKTGAGSHGLGQPDGPPAASGPGLESKFAGEGDEGDGENFVDE